MLVQQIHHVAYRCKDAAETVAFYRDVLDMPFLAAISEDRVPSTNEQYPYMHVFLDAGAGNIMAFFELPASPPMGRDTNTPEWVQHIAFLVQDEATLVAAKEKLEKAGVTVVGPTDHGFVKSIYFFDPNGHRLELTCHAGSPDMVARMHDVADQMLADWTKSKTTQRHTSWTHEQLFAGR